MTLKAISLNLRTYAYSQSRRVFHDARRYRNFYITPGARQALAVVGELFDHTVFAELIGAESVITLLKISLDIICDIALCEWADVGGLMVVGKGCEEIMILWKVNVVVREELSGKGEDKVKDYILVTCWGDG